MNTSRTTLDNEVPRAFADRVGVELNRAERYRVFVSMTVLDLAIVSEVGDDNVSQTLQKLTDSVRESVRACDYVTLLSNRRLALLFPETPRQGAEVASRRLAQLILDDLGKLTDRTQDGVIPVEIASYPDTAGAQTLSSFLEELVNRSRN